ncbi:MAG: LamG domain-containing protein [Candidatus Omnitrophica bacterium]|nr:LamG domain-containing protein [Candidatus Omnitrophota bacterium]
MKISSLSKGLVAHFPLDVASLRGALGLADKTPNSNHGVSANTPVFTTDRKGQANRAMSFNGTSDYIDLGNNASLKFEDGSQDFSIFAWIKKDATGSPYILENRDAGDDGWSFRIVNDYLWLQLNNIDVKSSSAITDNLWHRVGAVIDRDGNGQIYIDGVADGSPVSMGSQAMSISSNAFIGIEFDESSNAFDGSMADIRIYNRALNTQEITSLYEDYRPKLAISSLQKGLVLDMPLTSKRYDAGNTLFKDLTPYENTGVNTGGDVDVDHTTFVSANSDYVGLGNDSSLDITDEITISAWVNIPVLPDVDRYIVGYSPVGLEYRYVLHLNQQTIKAAFRDTLPASITTGNFISVDTWYHIVYTAAAGSTEKIYVNGVDTGASGTAGSTSWTGGSVNIGSIRGSSSYFNGDLSHAKIWNRALNAQEILLLYEKGRN